MTQPSGEPRAEPEPDDPWIGRTIAQKFTLSEQIGEGAMGRVYRAEHVSLGKPVAIKVLHRHLGGDPRIAKRFHREARAASRLSHPNSLQIIDFGEAGDGTLFIAMELLEGEDLQTLIDHDAPLSPRHIGEIMTQMLRALDEAHHAGIIHRDLKPENLVVIQTRGGGFRVKVCDFGIAKITESEGKSTAITKDGYVCGTPEYMAPEQARGDAIDPRADLYSAGVVLYHLLCAKVPFSAETALGIITKHLMEQPVPPRRVQPSWGIPRALERVALRALAKDPDERWPSAAEMGAAVESAVDALGDRADERLGHGSFAAAALEDDDDDDEEAREATTEEAIRAVVQPARGHTWLYALAGALALLAFGVWLWARPTAPASSADPVDRAESQPPTEPEPAAPTSAQEAAAPEREPAAERLAAEEVGAEGGTAAEEGTAAETDEESDEESAPIARPRATEAQRPRDRPRPGPRDPTPAPPTTPDPFDDGRDRMSRGDLRGAIAAFERAARAQPRNAQVHRQLGRAYMRLGDTRRGADAYRRYLALAPDAPDRAIIERLIE